MFGHRDGTEQSCGIAPTCPALSSDCHQLPVPRSDERSPKLLLRMPRELGAQSTWLAKPRTTPGRSMGYSPATALWVPFAVLSMGLFASSDAHMAAGGWTYPPACCNGNDVDGDCQAIPSSDVTEGPFGFAIHLHPGDHHLVTRNQLLLIPYGTEIPSHDSNYHICLQPTDDPSEAAGMGQNGKYRVNCFFVPPDSV
ncbi:hypothetical protein D9M68_270270 [compost metagenome]